jgi:hypothetical protein
MGHKGPVLRPRCIDGKGWNPTITLNLNLTSIPKIGWVSETAFRLVQQNCEKRLFASSCLSVCLSAWNNSATTERTVMKSDIWVFFENMSRKFKFHWNLIGKMSPLHEDLFAFMIISRWIPSRMRNVSDKSCRENPDTHFEFYHLLPNRAICEM